MLLQEAERAALAAENGALRAQLGDLVLRVEAAADAEGPPVPAVGDPAVRTGDSAARTGGSDTIQVHHASRAGLRWMVKLSGRGRRTRERAERSAWDGLSCSRADVTMRGALITPPGLCNVPTGHEGDFDHFW